MKIAILADPLDTQSAGIHVYTRELIKALPKVDTKNEYLIIRAKAGAAMADVEEIVLPIWSFLPFHMRIRQLVTIPRLLKQRKVDVVIEPAHFGPFNLPKSIKRVTIIHDLTPLKFPHFHPFMSVFFHKYFLKNALKQTDLVITNSEHTTKDVVCYFPFTKNKIKAILLGRDESYKPKEDKSILLKYKIRSDYFLYMGTIEPRKNLSVLLAAYEQYRAGGGKAIQLVLAGKRGWKIDELYEAVAASKYTKDILFTGFVAQEDMAILYTMARAFIYPSIYEGFGLPILEALSCGTRVVASSSSSMPEVGGDLALYFSPDDVDVLANHLVAIEAEGTTSVFQEEAIAWASRFTWKQMAQNFVKILGNRFLE